MNGLQPAAVLTEGADGWLPIVGIGDKPHVKVEVKRWGKKGILWFGFFEPANEPPSSLNTGDGTVPFLGACPDFLERERLVCVTPGDLELHEMGDRAMIAAMGLHGFLCNVNLVQRLVTRFLWREFDTDLKAHPAPGLTCKFALKWPPGMKIECRS